MAAKPGGRGRGRGVRGPRKGDVVRSKTRIQRRIIGALLLIVRDVIVLVAASKPLLSLSPPRSQVGTPASPWEAAAGMKRAGIPWTPTGEMMK